MFCLVCVCAFCLVCAVIVDGSGGERSPSSSTPVAKLPRQEKATGIQGEWWQLDLFS